MISPRTVDDRCLDWEDGAPLDLFNGMHFGLGFGPLSSYMTTQMESYDWWDSDTDPYSYFTMYTAMNHPSDDESSGYDFIGYDFSTGLYVEVDEDACVDVDYDDGTTETVCGRFKIAPSEDGTGYVYRTADFREDEGSRFAYVVGNAWWYEDFPNLDLDMMKEGFDMTGDTDTDGGDADGGETGEETSGDDGGDTDGGETGEDTSGDDDFGDDLGGCFLSDGVCTIALAYGECITFGGTWNADGCPGETDGGGETGEESAGDDGGETGGESAGDDGGETGEETSGDDGAGDGVGGCVLSEVCYPGLAYGECTAFGGMWIADGCLDEDGAAGLD